MCIAREGGPYGHCLYLGNDITTPGTLRMAEKKTRRKQFTWRHKTITLEKRCFRNWRAGVSEHGGGVSSQFLQGRERSLFFFFFFFGMEGPSLTRIHVTRMSAMETI